MSGQTDLSGTIMSGPPTVVDSTFPSMQMSVQLKLTPSPKGWQQCTGVLSRTLASPSAYVTLGGIGPTDDVTHADLLYFRCQGTIRLRITSVDGLSTLISEEDVSGLKVIEKPSAACITLVEAKGNGTIEYMAAGQS
jgi:hypothetical protein